jgi:tetratricopeptide (TPR) repeat protein
LAIDYEKFYYCFELLSWEKTLLEEAFEDGRFEITPDDLLAEEQDVILKLRNLADYHILYSKINYVFRSGGFARDEESKALVDEIANHPLILGKNTAKSKRAASICYYTQGFCHLANNNYNTAYDKFLKAKEILDSVPGIRADLAKRYIRTMAHLAFCLTERSQYDEARKIVSEIDAISEDEGFRSPDMRMTIFRTTHLSEFRILLKMGEFQKGMELVNRMLDEFSVLEFKLNKEQRMIFYYHIAYVYFGCGEFNRSLFWINKVLNENEKILRPDLFAYAQLFNLVIHYELGNYDLLEYITKSTKRYLTKRQRNFDLENRLIEGLRRLIKPGAHEDESDRMRKLLSDLQEIVRPEDEIALKFFDFVSWAESKVSGKAFSVIVASKAKPI